MKRTTGQLPDSVSLQFKIMASHLLQELETYKLRVELIEAPEQRHCGHMIRFATSHNPYWWSDLYHNYESRKAPKKTRKPHRRTSNKLDRTLFMGSLKRISEGNDDNRRYDEYCRNFLKVCVTEGFEDIPPDEQSIDYFKNIKELL